MFISFDKFCVHSWEKEVDHKLIISFLLISAFKLINSLIWLAAQWTHFMSFFPCLCFGVRRIMICIHLSTNKAFIFLLNSFNSSAKYSPERCTFWTLPWLYWTLASCWQHPWSDKVNVWICHLSSCKQEASLHSCGHWYTVLQVHAVFLGARQTSIHIHGNPEQLLYFS